MGDGWWHCRKKWVAWSWVVLCVAVVAVVCMHYMRPEYAPGVMDGTAYDAGRVKQGDVIRHVFEVVNLGRKTLSIKNTTASCSCAAAIQDGNKSIPPGRSLRIPIELDTKGRYGLTRARVWLRFDQPQVEPLALGIQCDVSGPVQVSPWQVNFGTVDKSKPVPLRTVFIRASPEDLAAPWDATSTNSSVTAEVVPIDRERYPELGDMTGRMLRVSLSQDVPAGELRGAIRVMDHARDSQLCEIPLHGWVPADLYVVPRGLFLGETALGHKVSSIVEVRRAPGCAVTVVSVKSTSPILSARVLESNKDERLAARIEVGAVLRTQDANGFGAGSIEVETTDPSNTPRIDVSWVATGSARE